MDRSAEEKAIKYFDAKLRRLKTIRTSYEDTWQQVIRYIAPDLEGYLNQENKDWGERNDNSIYDNAPTAALQKCAAGLFASISSPSRPWMQRKMSTDDYNEIPGVRAWLDAVTAKDYSIFHQSNFYRCAFSLYYQLAAIGTAVMMFEPDYDNVIHCTVLNVGEYWLGINGKGLVDTLFREVEYTAYQLKELFGEDKLPASVVQSMTESKPDGEAYKIIHVIEPDSQKLAPFRKPWVSVYYLKNNFDNKQIIDIKGYEQKPFASPRWYANNNETYGKMYPGRNSLGNCQQLEAMIYDYMDAVEKELNPPLQGSVAAAGEDGIISAIPGKFNSLNGSGPDATIKRLFEINPQLQIMWQAIQDKKQQIQEDFYIDLFMPVMSREDKDMTATEVNQISGEKMTALGPALENFHTEFLNVAMDIIFMYAMQARAYPPIANYIAQDDFAKLQGQDIKTDYVSILAQAQKYVDVSRITNTLQLAGTCAQLDQTALMKIDLMETIDEGAKLYGAPGKMIRSDEQVQQLQQQQQQQQQMQQLAQTAQTAADVAQKAGSISMDQNTALTQMLGVQQ